MASNSMKNKSNIERSPYSIDKYLYARRKNFNEIDSLNNRLHKLNVGFTKYYLKHDTEIYNLRKEFENINSNTIKNQISKRIQKCHSFHTVMTSRSYFKSYSPLKEKQTSVSILTPILTPIYELTSTPASNQDPVIASKPTITNEQKKFKFGKPLLKQKKFI